jgi:hypothetical protein
MLLFAKNCFTNNVLWAGALSCAKSTRFSKIPVVSFSRVPQFRQDFNVILLINRLVAGYSVCHHNTLDIKENNQHGLEENNQHGLELRMTRVLFLVLEMMLTSTALIVAWFPDHT